jgi:hypothetical protein
VEGTQRGTDKFRSGGCRQHVHAQVVYPLEFTADESESIRRRWIKSKILDGDWCIRFSDSAEYGIWKIVTIGAVSNSLYLG